MKPIWTTFRYTYASFRGQILGWGLGIGALGMLIVGMYPQFMAGKETFLKMIENYPPEFLAFFGGSPASMMTPEGILGMYGFSMLPVIIGIFSVMAGSGLFAIDEEAGRLDLILSHPVGRTRLFFGRLFAFIAAIVTSLVISWLGFCLLLGQSGMGLSWGQMALPFLPLLGQALIYGAIALLLSMLLPSRNLAGIIAGALMVTSYMVSSMSALDDKLVLISKLLPYAYYQSQDAINNFKPGLLAGVLGVTALLFLLAWWLFTRRDIRLGGEGSWIK